MKKEDIKKLIGDCWKIKQKGRFFSCELCKEVLGDLASCCNADEIFSISLLKDGSMSSEQVNVFYAGQGDEMLCPYCRETIGPWNDEAARYILTVNSK